MARGWESKSVEDQIEMARNRGGRRAKNAVPSQPPIPAAMETMRRKESLQLSVTHVTQELQSAQNPRYRAVLEKALADLQSQLAKV
jgi:hypothetical protein